MIAAAQKRFHPSGGLRFRGSPAISERGGIPSAGKREPRPLAVEATMESPLVDPLTGEDFGIPLLRIVDLVLDGQVPRLPSND